MAKKIEYEEIQKISMVIFRKAVQNPENYFIDERQIERLKFANDAEKYTLWQNFKYSANRKILKVHQDSISDNVKKILKQKIIDLRMGVFIIKNPQFQGNDILINEKSIKNLIKYPERYKKELDRSTFYSIYYLYDEEKSYLFEQISKTKYIDFSRQELPYYHSEIFKFFYKLLSKMSGTLDQIKDILVNILIEDLTTIIKEKEEESILYEVLRDVVAEEGVPYEVWRDLVEEVKEIRNKTDLIGSTKKTSKEDTSKEDVFE